MPAIAQRHRRLARAGLPVKAMCSVGGEELKPARSRARGDQQERRDLPDSPLHRREPDELGSRAAGSAAPMSSFGLQRSAGRSAVAPACSGRLRPAAFGAHQSIARFLGRPLDDERQSHTVSKPRVESNALRRI